MGGETKFHWSFGSNFNFPSLPKDCHQVLVPGLIYIIGESGSAAEKHLGKHSWGQLLDYFWTSEALSAGSADSVAMHLGCYQYFKDALALGVLLLWSQEGGQPCTCFCLDNINNAILVLSETSEYTWYHMGWKLSELSFLDGKWKFQTVWSGSVSKQTCSYFCLPEDVNSYSGLPYFTTFCCYWRSAVTHIPEGQVKWWLPVVKC